MSVLKLVPYGRTTVSPGNHGLGLIKPAYYYGPVFCGLSRLVGQQLSLPGGANISVEGGLDVGHFAIHPVICRPDVVTFYQEHVDKKAEWIPGHIHYMLGEHSDEAYPRGPILSFLVRGPDDQRQFGNQDINLVIRGIIGPTQGAFSPVIKGQEFKWPEEVLRTVRGDFWRAGSPPYVWLEEGWIPRFNYVHFTEKKKDEIKTGKLTAEDFPREFGVFYGKPSSDRIGYYFEFQDRDLVNITDKEGRLIRAVDFSQTSQLDELISEILKARYDHKDDNLTRLDFSRAVLECLLRDMRQFHIYQQDVRKNSTSKPEFKRKFAGLEAGPPPRIVFVMGPRCVGKTTIVREFCDKNPDVETLQVFTNKPKDDTDFGQVDTSTEAFEARMSSKFCAFEDLSGKWYGVTREDVERILHRRSTVVCAAGPEVMVAVAKYVYEVTGRTDLVKGVVIKASKEKVKVYGLQRKKESGRKPPETEETSEIALRHIYETLEAAGITPEAIIKNDGRLPDAVQEFANVAKPPAADRANKVSASVNLEKLQTSLDIKTRRLIWQIADNLNALIELAKECQPDNFTVKAVPKFEGLVRDIFELVNGYYPLPRDSQAYRHLHDYLVGHLLQVTAEAANLRGVSLLDPSKVPPNRTNYRGLRAALNIAGSCPFADIIYRKNLLALQELAKLPLEEAVVAGVFHDLLGKTFDSSTIYHDKVGAFFLQQFPFVLRELVRLASRTEREKIEKGAREKAEKELAEASKNDEKKGLLISARASEINSSLGLFGGLVRGSNGQEQAGEEFRLAKSSPEIRGALISARARAIAAPELERLNNFMAQLIQFSYIGYHHLFGDLFQGGSSLASVAEALEEDDELKRFLLEKRENVTAFLNHVLLITAMDVGETGNLNALSFNGMIQVKNALQNWLRQYGTTEPGYQMTIDLLRKNELREMESPICGYPYHDWRTRLGTIASFILPWELLDTQGDMAGVYTAFVRPILDANINLRKDWDENVEVINFIVLPYFLFELLAGFDRKDPEEIGRIESKGFVCKFTHQEFGEVRFNPAVFKLLINLAKRYKEEKTQGRIQEGQIMEVLLLDSKDRKGRIPARDIIDPADTSGAQLYSFRAYKYLRESDICLGTGSGHAVVYRETDPTVPALVKPLQQRFKMAVKLPSRARYYLVLDEVFSPPGPEEPPEQTR